MSVIYTSVGSVGEDEIAPGITRSGVLAEGAFDDYSFTGVENVPLTFDFTGTEPKTSTLFRVFIYQASDLDEPLYASLNYGAGNPDPLFGFVPPETGDYVFRIREVRDEVSYRVTAGFLSGTPQMRAEPTLLTYGESAGGAVTDGSFDRYRFTGTANLSCSPSGTTPVMFATGGCIR